MEQNFSLMAQSRANYYTAGSPVQFVRVELLKGDSTGEVAVCLTFKNVGTEPMTGLVIHFKCKDPSGQVLCEDDFYYEQLNANPGDQFGSDDAVYVSDTPVSSVEIELDRTFLNGRGVDLRGYKRVRLQTPRKLPVSIAKQLQDRTGNTQLNCVPQDTEAGWFCACGAFHPNEENATVCSECGGDRAYIKAALTHILEEARQAVEQKQKEVDEVEGTASQAAATAAAAEAAIQNQESQPQQEEANPELERVRRYNQNQVADDEDDEDEQDDHTRLFDAADTEEDEEDAPRSRKKNKRGRYADEDAESKEDVMAERIIHLAPPITAILCALIIAVALIYRFVIAA
jgi:hypothetical protein